MIASNSKRDSTEINRHSLIFCNPNPPHLWPRNVRLNHHDTKMAFGEFWFNDLDLFIKSSFKWNTKNTAQRRRIKLRNFPTRVYHYSVRYVFFCNRFILQPSPNDSSRIENNHKYFWVGKFVLNSITILELSWFPRKWFRYRIFSI